MLPANSEKCKPKGLRAPDVNQANSLALRASQAGKQRAGLHSRRPEATALAARGELPRGHEGAAPRRLPHPGRRAKLKTPAPRTRQRISGPRLKSNFFADLERLFFAGASPIRPFVSRHFPSREKRTPRTSPEMKFRRFFANLERRFFRGLRLSGHLCQDALGQALRRRAAAGAFQASSSRSLAPLVMSKAPSLRAGKPPRQLFPRSAQLTNTNANASFKLFRSNGPRRCATTGPVADSLGKRCCAQGQGPWRPGRWNLRGEDGRHLSCRSASPISCGGQLCVCPQGWSAQGLGHDHPRGNVCAPPRGQL